MTENEKRVAFLAQRLNGIVSELGDLGFKVSVLEGFQGLRQTETKIQIRVQIDNKRVVIEEVSV